MNIEEYREYCLNKIGATESLPFPNLPETLVFKVGGKMFASTNINTFASFSVRCTPETVDELRAAYPAVKEPSYFSRKHWIRVEMDGSITGHVLRRLLDMSYDIAVSKLTKKERLGLTESK